VRRDAPRPRSRSAGSDELGWTVGAPRRPTTSVGGASSTTMTRSSRPVWAKMEVRHASMCADSFVPMTTKLTSGKTPANRAGGLLDQRHWAPSCGCDRATRVRREPPRGCQTAVHVPRCSALSACTCLQSGVREATLDPAVGDADKISRGDDIRNPSIETVGTCRPKVRICRTK